MITSMDLVEAHIAAARSIFKSNLLVAFVGGSHAAGTAREDSDVDVFVVIDKPDRDAEVNFARAMARLHDEHGRKLDHFGEIFDSATLTNLLEIVAATTASWPAAPLSACYTGNCSLSAFRKGQVVVQFLVKDKTAVYDPHGRLYDFERLAARCIETAGDFTIPSATDVVDFGHRHDLAQLAASLGGHSKSSEALLDTPIGVGLERWFGPSILGSMQFVEPGVEPGITAGVEVGTHCPLSQPEPASAALRQCLSGIALLAIATDITANSTDITTATAAKAATAANSNMRVHSPLHPSPAVRAAI